MARRDHITLIERTMEDNEATCLIACCDCLLSLHRSEGFGRAPAEAMFFGKPAIATGWSGNMAYMNSEVSVPIRYHLVPVPPGEYLEWQDQLWAEPDEDHAVEALSHLVRHPEEARRMGEAARLHMLQHFSDEVLGQRYVSQFRELAALPCRNAVDRRCRISTHRRLASMSAMVPSSRGAVPQHLTGLLTSRCQNPILPEPASTDWP